MLINSLSTAKIIILDGLKRNALIGLVLLSLSLEVGGMLFFDFIPRDIGRASIDFILSIGWFTGLIFLFFHAVNVMAWGEDHRAMHTFLARPISRSQYVLGVFVGLGGLLLLLNAALGAIGLFILLIIQKTVATVYFPNLSMGYYFFSWVGLYFTQLIILSAITLISGLVRGGFPVLLITFCYYCICNGLPVVKESLGQAEQLPGELQVYVIKVLSGVFPNFNLFDYKLMVVSNDHLILPNYFPTICLFTFSYVIIALSISCLVYQQRDLQ